MSRNILGHRPAGRLDRFEGHMNQMSLSLGDEEILVGYVGRFCEQSLAILFDCQKNQFIIHNIHAPHQSINQSSIHPPLHRPAHIPRRRKRTMLHAILLLPRTKPAPSPPRRNPPLHRQQPRIIIPRRPMAARADRRTARRHHRHSLLSPRIDLEEGQQQQCEEHQPRQPVRGHDSDGCKSDAVTLATDRVCLRGIVIDCADEENALRYEPL